jgi:hypothetical protein
MKKSGMIVGMVFLLIGTACEKENIGNKRSLQIKRFKN